MAVTLLVVQACGSSDRKKAAPQGDAGMGGEAGASDGPDSGGSSAGSGTDSVGGETMGGTSSGSAGEAPSAGNGGEGGTPPSEPDPEPELLFTVKPGAIGLAGTALAAQAVPQNVIYSSKTAGQVKADGTNEAKVLGETLGLDEADQIVAFTLLQPEPQNPSYLFSMASGSQGGFSTRVYQAWEAGDEEGDVYFSDGVPSYRQLGEGGDQYGYNGLLAHESTLGLSSDIDAGVDDLGGLFVRDARAPITEVYFTVPIGAVGVPDSAVATVLAEERSCTVFRSGLDGNNTVAFSCADLGLVAYDRIDGLLVYGDDAPSKLAFSVSSGAYGAATTAVADAYLAGDPIGAMLFASPGDGTNSLLKTAEELGLGALSNDELDGLAVIETPLPRPITSASCELDYDPRDLAEGALTYIGGVLHIGPSVMVVAGQTASTPRYIAYDATSCEFLQQKDMPGGFANVYDRTIAPLPGWSAATPLDDVEHFQVGPGASSPQKFLNRMDADGTFVDALPISTVLETARTRALLHEPVSDRLFLLIASEDYDYPTLLLAALPRPDGVLTSLDTPLVKLALPCSGYSDVTGTDLLGNLYVAQRQGTTAQYRVCGWAPSGELLPAPYFWSPEGPIENRGFLAGGQAHFLLSTDVTTAPAAIERGVFEAP